MSTSAIITFLLIAVIAFFVIKRFLNAKSVKQYSPVEAKEKMKNNTVVLLDVRTKSERASRKINGSIHIPLNELHNRADELNKHKQKEIICYCRSGNRSLSAAVLLKKKGYNIANLKGGIVGWS